MIESMETFHDANLTVINHPRDEIVNFIGGIDDSALIQKLVQEGSLDSKRRNIKLILVLHVGSAIFVMPLITI